MSRIKSEDPVLVQAERKWRREIARVDPGSVSRRILDQEQFPGRRIDEGFKLRGFEDWPPPRRRASFRGSFL